MAQAVKKHAKVLMALALMTPKERKAVLKAADKSRIQSVCECAHNLLKGNIAVSDQQKRKLRKHKQALRRLVKKGESLGKKRRFIIQKGGGVLIPLLLSTVLQALLN